MCADIVKQVLQIEREADRIVAEAEAQAKRILAGSAEEAAAFRKKSAEEAESAAARTRAEFEQSWKTEEESLRREHSARLDHIQKSGNENLSSVVAWIVKKVTRAQ